MSRRPQHRLSEEHGISLVAAILTLGLLIMVSAVAVQQAVSALRGTSHQARSKNALQAADAAIDAAIFGLNRADLGSQLNIDPLDPTSIVEQGCLVSAGTPGAIDMVPLAADTLPDTSGRRWCPATDAETLDTGASFQYRVSELLRVTDGDCAGLGSLSLDREIVAVGTSGDESRRVKATLRASVSLLSGAAVQSGSATTPMQMSGTARVLGDVQSNHDIQGVATNVISGRATPGAGSPVHTVTGVLPVGSIVAACQRFVLPAVAQGTAPSANDNPVTISERCYTSLMVISSCSLPVVGTTGGVEWDPSQRTLRIWGNGIVTLTESTYSFCKLEVTGQGILQIANSSPVTRVFMDDPANCPGVTGAGQASVDGSARMVNCHLQTQPETFQMYGVGSESTATTQTISGSGTLSSSLLATLCGLSIPAVGTPMILYAPLSTVNLGGSAAISGQVVGNTIVMSGAAAVEPINALVNINQLGTNPTLALYQPTDYVECSGKLTFDNLPVNDPAQGC